MRAAATSSQRRTHAASTIRLSLQRWVVVDAAILPCRGRGHRSFTFPMLAAPRAAASTSSSDDPVLAWIAAITAPSTSGASAIRTLPRRCSSTSSSMASCADSTAEPRSAKTSTPSPSSASAIAWAISVASVPMPPSSVPPAARSLTPAAICAAISTTPSATFAECDTTTSPTVTPMLHSQVQTLQPYAPRSGSDAPAQARSMHRRVPKPRQLVVQPQDGDRGALHLQRGDVGADQVAVDAHAALVQQLVDPPVDHVQLGERGAAHRVDERQHALAGGEAQVLDDRPGDAVGELVGALHLDALAARLAVDADADLDLVVAQVEGGRAGGRHGARAERQPHRADVVDHLLGQVGDAVEVGALLGLGADELLEQHGPADSAPALGVERVLDGHVVVDGDAGDLLAAVAGQVGGHLEVHDVAGVVLDDVQHAGAAVDLVGGPFHLVGRWRGEHRAGTGGVEHAEPDEAAVHGLVAGATAADQADLAGPRRIGPVDHGRVEVHRDHVAVRQRQAFERFGYEVVDGVDELFHDCLLLERKPPGPPCGAPGDSRHGRSPPPSDAQGMLRRSGPATARCAGRGGAPDAPP